MDRIIVSLSLVVSLASGCAHASRPDRSVQYLVRHERAGVLELRGNIMDSTPRAHVVMTEHCDGRWRLLEGAEAIALHASAAGKSQAAPAAPITVDDRHLAFECRRQ